ncbi:MATE family efflux transporter [Persicirhabdus sediminis]|uniref:Multidrug-efflux transporter n=1 Tax=Persicirhabdus sediminis TaxID=454144 RepID=A0A8J7MD19_9BACT|nr:MATE family efflux transporter [Persicirhabdus sediminis]MBK1791132.1 MATE family efflux transporter [Persicirhabdus sediminis]
MRNNINPTREVAPPPSGGKLGGRLAGLSLAEQVAVLAFWPFLQNLLSVAVGFADLMIAGRMTDESATQHILDMMGLAMYIIWLLMIVQGAVATGAMAVVARATGANDIKTANHALGQSLLLGVGSGAVSGFVIWLAIPSLTAWFGLSPEAAEYADVYFNVLVWTAPLSGVLFVANSCLRGFGDTMRPFLAMVVVNGANIIVSYILVFGPDPIGGMGVKGLAIGTLVGWFFGVLAILYFMKGGCKCSSLDKTCDPDHGKEPVMDRLVLHCRNLKPDVAMMRRILRVGLPSVVEILVMWGVHAFGLKMIATATGDGMLGAHGMVVRLESLSFMPGFALGSAAGTLAGQYLGAGDEESAKRSVRVCWLTAVVLMGAAGFLMAAFAKEFLYLLSPNGGDQIEIAVPVVQLVGCFQCINATALVIKMSMRGAGATRLVTIVSFGSMLSIRVGLLYFVVNYMSPSLMSIWIVLTIDVVVQALIFTFMHYKPWWMRVEV